MTSFSPSLGWVSHCDRTTAIRIRRQGADCFDQQILDIIRAVIFQKALESTKQISPANSPETVPTAAFWVILTDAWAFISIALPKLAVGILIIHLFRPQRWLKASIMTLCISLNVLAIVGFIITFAQCSPAAGQWNPFQYPQTRCWNRAVQIIYSCVVSGTYLKIQHRGHLFARTLK